MAFPDVTPLTLSFDPVISIRGLNFWYVPGDPRTQVLRDNCLEIMPGEIVIMTGRSGSGKTTLLTLIGALRRAQEGKLLVLGQSLTHLSKSQLVGVRRQIGFIFQAHNLIDSLTASQNVQLGLQLHLSDPKARRQRAADILATLGLGKHLDYKPKQLSGGQKQRVAIARALAHKPKLVLADEPTAALDEKAGQDVMTLLKQLSRADGCTSLIVTHDDRILEYADRIVNLSDGRINSNVVVKESVVMCEFLKQCPVFAGLTPIRLTNVAAKMTREKIPAGTVIFREGDVGDKFYLIRTGSVDIVQDDQSPTRRVLRVQGVGEFFGERALLSGDARSATVISREPVEAYTLGKADFTEAIAASPSFKQELQKVYFSYRG